MDPLEFNLSHTDGGAVCAMTLGHRLGVDVEARSSRVQCLELARRYYARPEIDRFHGLAPEEAEELALDLWTLKEAFTKALGLGLHLPFDRFSIDPVGAGPARLEYVLGRDESPDAWQFAQFRLRPALVAAVAVQWPGERDLIIHSRPWQSAELTPHSGPLPANPRRRWEL